jgi:hypothetical protein
MGLAFSEGIIGFQCKDDFWCFLQLAGIRYRLNHEANRDGAIHVVTARAFSTQLRGFNYSFPNNTLRARGTNR